MAAEPLRSKTNDVNQNDQDEINETYKRYQQRISLLPQAKGFTGVDLCLYQGFWYRLNVPSALPGLMSMQERFSAKQDDILVASFPKSGTTWLKALVFAVMNRTRFNPKSKDHPLLTNVPHKCIPFLEILLFKDGIPSPTIDSLSSPRLLSTHVAYTSLPLSLIDCHCKIVYIARDPKDVLVSFWHYASKITNQQLRVKARAEAGTFLLSESSMLEEAYDFFIKGIWGFGPYWDHVLSYWKASLESPDKVLFLKYEDLKRETELYVGKLGQFLGCPFNLEEEESGVVKQIVELCSFQTLSNLQVNKTGLNPLSLFTNDVLFRKAEVGDWENHLTSEMAQRLDHIIKEKLDGSGLIL